MNMMRYIFLDKIWISIYNILLQYENTSYDVILIDDYTRHKNLFLEYTASSFYMSGGEKIMASCYENTTIIGFPDTRIHDVFGGGEDEISHILTFIRSCIMKEFQTLR